MENSLNNLKEAYDNFSKNKFGDASSTQKLFNCYNLYTQSYNHETNWSCGGCIRRVKERTERILKLNNLL